MQSSMATLQGRAIDDMVSSRKLLPTKEVTTEQRYTLSVKTADVKGASTDGRVWVTMFGSKDNSGRQQLRQSLTHKRQFERGQEDVFEIYCADIGTLQSVRIEHNSDVILSKPKSSNIYDGWLLESLSVHREITVHEQHPSPSAAHKTYDLFFLRFCVFFKEKS